ncbi:MAG TPA: SprT family zinc-dependent metalloprotease [Sphingomonas sp.]|uniref:M48 family metallopeptidase n=1 Tax=Sphingomonas sp. TaxID=28214 RepID=UPI002C50BC9F|nr:SprT family zinc-dependent metalloprotease [Sphingomonas sp.]HMI18933.1 SprT family zinc-dependent metalloprotease [Sphingomonas sp.]
MSTESSDLTFSAGGHTRQLTVKRSALARRMRLAVDPRDGAIRLTLPRRAALGPALKWAESQRAWIEKALAKLPATEKMGPGSTIPFEGATLTIDWDSGGSRTVRREGDRLIVGGPEEMVMARVLRWLKAEAARRLDAETRAAAERAGVTIGRVRVGDPRSRWGSCSAGGDIAYSWRLILMPPAVREATVVHEVAHRLHMHHGPEFHAAVEALLGRAPKVERDWLKAHGAAMHRVGR